jgi:phosphoenolpyruvate synthase/pyruvate phosphate dikinase
VVARQLGKVCLVGCAGLEIDMDRRRCAIGGTLVAEGDPISIDGNTGAIYAGALSVLTERPERELAAVARWRAAEPTGSPCHKRPVAVRNRRPRRGGAPSRHASGGNA